MKLSRIVFANRGVRILGAEALSYFVKLFHLNSDKHKRPSKNEINNRRTSNKYDKTGFDKDGFDREGRDRNGRDKNGFDAEGYDRNGFDRTGYNRYGYDRGGFNREGLDRGGYDRCGYNVKGVDRAEKSRAFYIETAEDIESIAGKAHKQMKQGEFPYALHDIREGFEIAAHCIVSHWRGEAAYKKRLSKDIETCRKYLGEEMFGKIKGAIRHCNDTQHANDAMRHEKTYDQTHFCYMTLLEVAAIVKTLGES